MNAAYISNTSLPAVAGRPDGGSYALEFMLLTKDAATSGTPFQVPGGCLPLSGAGTLACQNVILVRSTGTVTGPPAGYTRSRTLQALIKADSTSVFAGGITAGSSGTGAIRGNAKIYGTIHILPYSGGSQRHSAEVRGHLRPVQQLGGSGRREPRAAATASSRLPAGGLLPHRRQQGLLAGGQAHGGQAR